MSSHSHSVHGKNLASASGLKRATGPNSSSSVSNAPSSKAKKVKQESEQPDGDMTIDEACKKLLSALDDVERLTTNILDMIPPLIKFKKLYDANENLLHAYKDDKIYKDKVKRIDEAYEAYYSERGDLPRKDSKKYRSELENRILETRGALHFLRYLFFTESKLQALCLLQLKCTEVSAQERMLKKNHSDGLNELDGENGLFPPGVTKEGYKLLEDAHSELMRRLNMTNLSDIPDAKKLAKSQSDYAKNTIEEKKEHLEKLLSSLKVPLIETRDRMRQENPSLDRYIKELQKVVERAKGTTPEKPRSSTPRPASGQTSSPKDAEDDSSTSTWLRALGIQFNPDQYAFLLDEVERHE